MRVRNTGVNINATSLAEILRLLSVEELQELSNATFLKSDFIQAIIFVWKLNGISTNTKIERYIKTNILKDRDENIS